MGAARLDTRSQWHLLLVFQAYGAKIMNNEISFLFEFEKMIISNKCFESEVSLYNEKSSPE